MNSEEVSGLSPGRSPEFQVEAAVVGRVGVKKLLGRRAPERAAARGVCVGVGIGGLPGRFPLLELLGGAVAGRVAVPGALRKHFASVAFLRS